MQKYSEYGYIGMGQLIIGATYAEFESRNNETYWNKYVERRSFFASNCALFVQHSMQWNGIERRKTKVEAGEREWERKHYWNCRIENRASSE